FVARRLLTLGLLALGLLTLGLLTLGLLTLGLLTLGLLTLHPFPLGALALLFRALLLYLGFRLARGDLALLLLPFAGSLYGGFVLALQHLRALLARQIGEEAGAVAREEKVPCLERPHFFRRLIVAARVAGIDRRRRGRGNERHIEPPSEP